MYTRNIFELSYTTEKKLEKFSREDFIKYVDEKYSKKIKIEKDSSLEKESELNRDKLSKDLIALKSYRDKIQSKLNNVDVLDRLFDKIMLFCSIIAAVIVANKLMNFDIVKELKRDLKTSTEKSLINQKILDTWRLFNKFSVDLFYALLIAFIILVISVALFFIKRMRNQSLSNKLIYLNNAIYTLEAIKEGMYQQNDEEKNKNICRYQNQINDISMKLDKIIENSETNGRNGINEEKLKSLHVEEMQKLRQESIRDMSAFAVIFLCLRKLTDKNKK